jgi:6-phosphogluconolactonase (cycloisomerase 2 family)
MTVTPGSASVVAGSTQQFSVKAGYSDGSSKDVSSSATWASATTSVATISAAGLATGVKAGTSNITATFQSLTSSAAVLTVTAPTVTSVAVMPSGPSIVAGTTQQFTAMATYSDTSTSDVTSSATWASATTSVATISATGLVTGVAAGASNITATFQTVVSTAVTLTVTPAPVLQSIAVTPANPTVASPNTQQFTATGTYLTGTQSSTQDITSKVTWSSTNTASATITAAGLATTNGSGTTTITTTLGSVSGSTTLTVTGTPVVASLVVSPATDTVSVGSTVGYFAVEKLSDGTTRPPTGTITWSSNTTATATIGTNNAIAIAAATGTTVITATEGSATGTGNLTAQAAAARFAFNADQGQPPPPPPGSGGLLTEWSVTPATPAFSLITTTATVNGMQQVIVHPSGHFFYAIDRNGALNQYDINSTTGGVTNDANPVVPTTNGGQGLSKAAIDPSGRFLYLVNAPNTGFTPAIYSFAIDVTNPATLGALTAIGSPIATNLGHPSDILIDKTGNYAYVVDGGTGADSFSHSGPGTVFQFSIDQNTGALSPLTPASVATGQDPWYGALNPAGTFMYVPNVVDASVSVYSVGGSGVLTQVGTDVVITTATHPFGAAVDPSGKYLYVGDFDGANVYGFVIQANGTVSNGSQTPSSPYVVGATSSPAGAPTAQPFGITIDPSGTLVVVENNGFDSFTPFTLNPSSGALTGSPDVPTGHIPFYLTFYTALAGQ